MPYAVAADQVKLYFEDTGQGVPIVFVHEYANDLRGWEAQVRYFSRSHRCVTYNARGYPPSDVPQQDGLYGQEQAVADVGAMLDHLGLDKAYIVGLSMGAAAGLFYTLSHPERVLGLVFAAGGSGSDRASRERFVAEARQAAEVFLQQGMGPFVDVMSWGPTRIQLRRKDPRGWEEFRTRLAEHSPVGAALTMRNYQARRPSMFDFESQLKALAVPTLIVVGDEDDPVLETSLFLKRSLPASGMVMMAKTGHAVNLEEPDAFNRAVQEFLTAVERGRWGRRDARADANRSAMLPDAHTTAERSD